MKKFPRDFKTALIVIIGSFLSASALNMFVYHANLIPAGFSGISLLTSRALKEFYQIDIPFMLLYYLLNIPVTILVFKYVGKRFTYFSLLNVVCFGLFSQILPHFRLTDDLMLLSIFGGVLNGVGALIVLEGNASGGGTDFIAIYTANRYQKATWSYVLAFNAVLILLSALIFDVNAALYSIIYQFTSTMIVNSYHSRYKLATLHIFTEQPEVVAKRILEVAKHGITRLDGTGMYQNKAKSMLYLVCSDFEVKLIVKAIREVDPKAFINEFKSRRVIGTYFLKPLE